MLAGCPMCAEIGADCGRHDNVSGGEGPDLAPDTPECPACARSQGLCRRHRRGILPQLAQPFWYKLVGTHHQKSAVEEMSPEARRVFNRKRTKAARAAARQAQMAATRLASLAGLLPAA